ncbi:cellulase [Ranunculus cassubicifolius]
MVALPLSTNSRWIVDEHGKRVKLACVNWPSHTETLLVEGLNKIALDQISARIIATGFNCVRLTWPTTLATNNSLASTIVEKHFKNLGLYDAIEGIRIHNPKFLSFNLIQAFRAIIANLGANNVMVILDNHISKPGWCCGGKFYDGFFGDQNFDPKDWHKGLIRMACMFKRTKNVVGMSLRNELRGPNQNVDEWRWHMEKAAAAVHGTNPHILIILSGLAFDNDLSFLKKHPVNITFERKLLFEVHRFGCSIKHGWAENNPNDECGSFARTFMYNAGFLLERGFPLFLSEFGGDQSGTIINDSRFLNCVFGVIADLDLEWALWALQGSYYLRQGVQDMEEFWGVLDKSWNDIRNSSFMQRVNSIQFPYQGPGLFNGLAPHEIIYHPVTGYCLQRNSFGGHLRLGLCQLSTAWNYNVLHKTITLDGTRLCLQAIGHGKPVRLGTDCSKWNRISRSRMHISTKLINGEIVCLDVQHTRINSVLVTNLCTCLTGDPKCDPSKQWFNIVKSQRQVLGL